MPDTSPAQPGLPQNRVWRVGAAEFDESRRELRVGGRLRAVEAKPLLILEILLSRAGDTVTKEELLATVWKDRTVVEQSLTTAVGKLREALGDEGRAIIEAVRGVGYRIGLPIELRTAPEKPRLAFTFQPNDPVPNRPQWRLDRPLGSSAANDVWLARHEKTGEQRVFKFADTTQRLEALKREAALSRILHNALGDRPDLVRISEWSFDTRPFFIESPFGGADLPEWAAAQGGLSAIPLSQRIAIVARIARTAAAAHDVGVLHRDIKPSNILVSGEGETLTIRLVDFGSGRLTEAARLEAVTVTGLGLTAATPHDGERLSGTLRYMAPEIVAGGPPSIAADVYALGVLLYQMIVGDLDRPLTVGCETEITDKLLRQDVLQAASRPQDQRLPSAAVLADRLESLDARRSDDVRREYLEAETRRLAAKLDRTRLRRPWLVLAAASLALGLVVASISTARALRARDQAEQQSATALAINQFLTDDLLGRGNPASSGNANETLMQAVEAAEPMIEQRLARQPMLAASIYVTLTKAFDGRGAFDASRHAYDRAQAILTQTEGADSADVVILLLRRAGMETMSGQPGSLEKGNAIIASMAPRVARLGARQQEARAWLFWARGQAQTMPGDMDEAQKDYAQAASIAETLPQAFDPQMLFSMRGQYGFSLLKLGRWKVAETVFNKLVKEQTLVHGPLHPNVLSLDLNLAELALLSGHPELAVQRIDQIYPAFGAVFGPNGRKTLQALSVRVEASLYLGRYGDAERDGISLHDQATIAQGKTSWFAFAGLGAAGEAECRAGDAEKGVIKVQEAFETSRTALGDANPITQSAKATIAECLVLDGRPTDAQSLLDQIDCKALAGLTGQPDYCADTDVIRAATALKGNDPKEAQRLLTDASKYFGPQPTDLFFKQWADRLQTSVASAGPH